MDLPDHPHGAHYVVEGGVQNAFGGIVAHHEGVVSGRPHVIWTLDYGRALVQESRLQHFEVLVGSGVPWFFTNLPSRVVKVFYDSYRTMQGGSRPYKMNSTMVWVFSTSWSIRWPPTIWTRWSRGIVKAKAAIVLACSWCTLQACHSSCSWA